MVSENPLFVLDNFTRQLRVCLVECLPNVLVSDDLTIVDLGRVSPIIGENHIVVFLPPIESAHGDARQAGTIGLTKQAAGIPKCTIRNDRGKHAMTVVDSIVWFVHEQVWLGLRNGRVLRDGLVPTKVGGT